MKTILVSLLLLAQAAPVAPPMVCTKSVGYLGSSFELYACTTGTLHDNGGGTTYPDYTPISKPWFKAHCTTKGAKKAPGYGTVAVCDAYAVPDGALVAKDAAGPSKAKQRFEEIAIGAVGGLIIAACVAGGGCGFMGG